MSLESSVTERIECLKKERINLKKEIEEMGRRLGIIQTNLYEEEIRQLHISEAFRLARIHFPRLNGHKNRGLSLTDEAELEKWIKRAGTIDGLRDIVDAIRELQKYYPSDVKINLYALVQKIISGGAYHSKRQKK